MGFGPHLAFKGAQEPPLYTKQATSDHPVGSINLCEGAQNSCQVHVGPETSVADWSEIRARS